MFPVPARECALPKVKEKFSLSVLLKETGILGFMRGTAHLFLIQSDQEKCRFDHHGDICVLMYRVMKLAGVKHRQHACHRCHPENT
jgi:hypothetical protein